jgi:hypothetical protein
MLKKSKWRIEYTEDLSGTYIQVKDGKVFTVEKQSNIGVYDDYILVPVNFDGIRKEAPNYLMSSWVRRGLIRPFDPLEPNFVMEKLKFKPMSSLIQDMLETRIEG